MPNFQWTPVGAFGGGLDYTKLPSALREDQWADSTGFLARDGCAETANDLVLHADLSGSLSQATAGIIGAVQNPWTQDGGIVASVNATGLPATSTGVGRLFTVSGNSVVVELTGNPAVGGNRSGVLQSAFIGGKAMVSLGYPGTFAPSTATWDGSAAYTALFVGPVPGPERHVDTHFFCGFAEHPIWALGAAVLDGVGFQIYQDGGRTLYWGAVDTPDDPIPSIFNDADFVTLDDLGAGICLMTPLGNSICALFTRSSISVLQPTGSIPAFTRQLLVQGLGAYQVQRPGFTALTTNVFRHQAFWGYTPYGVVFRGQDNLYMLSSAALPTPLGTPIFRAYQAGAGSGSVDPVADYHQTFVWHEPLGMLFVHAPLGNGTTFVFEPRNQTWAKLAYTTPSAYLRSAFLYGFDANGQLVRQYWAMTRTGIYREGTTPIATGTVDTKDFAFGSPPYEAYVDRIKVDWEGLTNPATDALDVYVSARDDFSRGVLGVEGQITAPPFTFVGTLASGASELSVRQKGKYIRFRFQQRSGHARVRGFAIRQQPAADVKTGP